MIISSSVWRFELSSRPVPRGGGFGYDADRRCNLFAAFPLPLACQLIAGSRFFLLSQREYTFHELGPVVARPLRSGLELCRTYPPLCRYNMSPSPGRPHPRKSVHVMLWFLDAHVDQGNDAGARADGCLESLGPIWELWRCRIGDHLVSTVHDLCPGVNYGAIRWSPRPQPSIFSLIALTREVYRIALVGSFTRISPALHPVLPSVVIAVYMTPYARGLGACCKHTRLTTLLVYLSEKQYRLQLTRLRSLWRVFDFTTCH